MHRMEAQHVRPLGSLGILGIEFRGIVVLERVSIRNEKGR